MLQNATPFRKSAARPPNISDENVLFCSCHAKSVFADPLQMSHACHRFWKCYKTGTFCSLLAGCRLPCACYTKRRFNVQKRREHVVFCAFWLRNVLRANSVHFLNISTSKSALNAVCFVHFDFEMCFAPQQRTLFEHLNFQKCTERGVLCTFWLRHVLRAATACTFSTSQWLWKVVRTWCVLYILTSKYASRYSGVQFFISHLARWLRTRRLSEPTCRPAGATNHWKNKVFCDLSTFSRTCIFFLLTFSLLWYSLFSSLLFSSLLWLCPPLLFHLSILSEVWLLNFLR